MFDSMEETLFLRCRVAIVSQMMLRTARIRVVHELAECELMPLQRVH
ncbi:hypothetical protein ABIE20_004580 [Pseudomonas sp. 2835]